MKNDRSHSAIDFEGTFYNLIHSLYIRNDSFEINLTIKYIFLCIIFNAFF